MKLRIVIEARSPILEIRAYTREIARARRREESVVHTMALW